MAIVMTILILIVLFIAIISATVLHINIIFCHEKENDYVQIQLKIWFGLIRYTIKLPFLKLVKNPKNNEWNLEYETNVSPKNQKKTKFHSRNNLTPEELRQMIHKGREFLKNVKDLKKILKHFCRHISVDSLVWESVVGEKNAALTGILTGALWAAKGEFIGLLSKWIRLKTMPKINVVPSFQTPYTKIRLECMLHFRIGYAIIAGLKIVRFWKGKQLQERESSFVNDQNQSI
ncbi:MAG: DUF2953 domain-containing protein [Bacillales bacterium]|nr:DUF2953 domain-containing protein [Bacillales bacterium]